MDAHLMEVKWQRFVTWLYVMASSLCTIPTVFCENSTAQAVCESCDLAEKHKLYNWLVLCIVLLLLVLLLVLVAFLCHRMWPRERSALERAVCRYNSEQQQALTQVSTSSWGTETVSVIRSMLFKLINCDRPQTSWSWAIVSGTHNWRRRKKKKRRRKNGLRLAVKTLYKWSPSLFDIRRPKTGLGVLSRPQICFRLNFEVWRPV